MTIQIFRPVTDSQYEADTLLGGRVEIRQPRQGYRSAIDPIFLAAAVTAKSTDTILDAGAGVGAAALCLAHRVPGCRIVAVDIQEELVALLVTNFERNGFADRLTAEKADLAMMPQAPLVDHAMANPPFYKKGSGTRSPSNAKALSHQESSLTLSEWANAMIGRLTHKGVLTMIIPTDRLSDLLVVLHHSMGDIRLFPLWPKRDQAAKRIIVRARRGLKSPLTFLPGLILHEENGEFTDNANRILTDGEPLDWTT